VSRHMAVSIHDMQNFAERMAGPGESLSSDIGNVIQLGGDNIDDLGMSLLANNRVSTKPPAASENTVHVNAVQDSGAFSLGPLEPLEPISLDIPTASANLGPLPDIQVNKDSSSAPLFSDNNQTATGPGVSLRPQAPRMSPEEEREKKADLINKLSRLESKGYQVSKRFTMDNSYDEIKQEFDRLMDARNLEGSIKFQRQMMMGFVTGVELMNNKFNPFDWQLEGWSESVHENIDDFDEVFEELYDKYKTKGNMPPEARLLFLLAGSGFMFHMSNNFFRSKMNNMSMDDIFRQNPQLRQQFATAAAQAAGPGFGNFMGMTMGQSQPAPAQQPQQAPMPQQNMFFNAPNAPPQAMPPAAPPVQRREMKGPSGVDDILRTFQEVRDAEVAGPPPIYNEPPMMPSPASGPTTQPARQALAEIQSIHSEEGMSQAESMRTGRTGATASGSRRRKAQIPIANSISLAL
jgi:hypothetical protein